MKRYDLVSSLFWVMCAILIVIGALRLPVGTPINSGPGFFPLLIGGLLAILSIILFFTIILRKDLRGQKIADRTRKEQWYRVVSTIFVLLIYTITFRRLGFLFTTFLLMAFLFKGIGKLSWKVSIGGALLTSFFSYILFKVWLKVEFPAGLLGM